MARVIWAVVLVRLVMVCSKFPEQKCDIINANVVMVVVPTTALANVDFKAKVHRCKHPNHLSCMCFYTTKDESYWLDT